MHICSEHNDLIGFLNRLVFMRQSGENEEAAQFCASYATN